jgi:general secretion pathway protein G
MKILTPLPVPSRRRGFTLIELLLVLSIIGLLTAGGAAVYSGIMDQAKVTGANTKIGVISGMIQNYNVNHSGKFPSQSLGLGALRAAGMIKNDDEVTDPWGQPFIYTFPAKSGCDKYDLWSKGADGIENTPDDVGNWKSNN